MCFQCLCNLAELESKDVKLVDLIQTLGEYLNDEDGAIREKSTTPTASYNCTDAD